MSNSIIDQQRDNTDFFWVQYSWLPGPVKRYDYDAEYKYMQEQGAKLVYPESGSPEATWRLLQQTLNIGRGVRLNPFYWIEDEH